MRKPKPELLISVSVISLSSQTEYLNGRSLHSLLIVFLTEKRGLQLILHSPVHPNRLSRGYFHSTRSLYFLLFPSHQQSQSQHLYNKLPGGRLMVWKGEGTRLREACERKCFAVN